jgi:hypothetical protein
MLGLTWNFNYPVALGGGKGVDHSYAVNQLYALAARPEDGDCWDPDADPDKRVVAGDGWWMSMANLSGVALVTGQYDDPGWWCNRVGYRHKFAANLLHRDGHVALAAYDVDEQDYRPDCNESGLDTAQHCIWRPGESLYVGGSSGGYDACDGEPGCVEYPAPAPDAPPELDPNWYTANGLWTIADIYEYKGWVRPDRGDGQEAGR